MAEERPSPAPGSAPTPASPTELLIQLKVRMQGLESTNGALLDEVRKANDRIQGLEREVVRLTPARETPEHEKK